MQSSFSALYQRQRETMRKEEEFVKKKCTVLQVVVDLYDRHSCVHHFRWTGSWNAFASINVTAVCALTAGQEEKKFYFYLFLNSGC